MIHSFRGPIHQLFIRRWSDLIRKHYSILRSIVDLIVVAYIVIPGLLIFARIYYSMWREGLPSWVFQLPHSTISLVLMGFIYVGGGLILYLEAADVLFLRQNPRWVKGIMLRGMLVSFVKQAILVGAIIVILLPLLLRAFGMDIKEVASLYTVTIGIKYVHMMLENLISIKFRGWKRNIILSLVFGLLAAGFTAWFVNGGALYGAVLLLCIVVTVLLSWYRFRIQGRFEAEVSEDERQKMRIVSFLLAGSVDRPSTVRSRPWLFRHSNPLFPSRRPEARVAEIVVKSFFRGKGFKLYTQFTLLGFIAVLVAPYPTNMIIFVLLLLLLVFWLNSYQRHFFSRELMAILPEGSDMEFSSTIPVLRALLMPAVLCLSLGLGISTLHTFWGALLSVPCGLIISWWLVSFLWKIFLSKKL